MMRKMVKMPLKVITKQKPTILVSLNVVFLESSLTNCCVYEMLPTSAGIDRCLVLSLGLLQNILPERDPAPCCCTLKN